MDKAVTNNDKFFRAFDEIYKIKKSKAIPSI